MEYVKGILIIVGIVGLGLYVLRLLWRALGEEDDISGSDIGPDMDRMINSFDEDSICKKLDYKLPSCDEVLNTGFPEWTISSKNKLNPTLSRPILKSSSNDGFIWTESSAVNDDSFDNLYHTNHAHDDSPSFGNGGDFGGGGASGSWDSGSSSDSSYDSGSSDSSSSWND